MTCIARTDAFPSKFTKAQRKKSKQLLSPGRALKASLRQAAAQNRLTIGLKDSVHKLKRNPESVMVCLMLKSPSGGVVAKDKTTCNIQHTLLQAFCAEWRINIVRVSANTALRQLVGQLAGRVKVEAPLDCGLLLIQHPEESPSAEDLVWASACQAGCLDLWTGDHLPTD